VPKAASPASVLEDNHSFSFNSTGNPQRDGLSYSLNPYVDMIVSRTDAPNFTFPFETTEKVDEDFIGGRTMGESYAGPISFVKLVIHGPGDYNYFDNLGLNKSGKDEMLNRLRESLFVLIIDVKKRDEADIEPTRSNAGILTTWNKDKIHTLCWTNDGFMVMLPYTIRSSKLGAKGKVNGWGRYHFKFDPKKSDLLPLIHLSVPGATRTAQFVAKNDRSSSIGPLNFQEQSMVHRPTHLLNSKYNTSFIFNSNEALFNQKLVFSFINTGNEDKSVTCTGQETLYESVHKCSLLEYYLTFSQGCDARDASHLDEPTTTEAEAQTIDSITSKGFKEEVDSHSTPLNPKSKPATNDKASIPAIQEAMLPEIPQLEGSWGSSDIPDDWGDDVPAMDSNLMDQMRGQSCNHDTGASQLTKHQQNLNQLQARIENREFTYVLRVYQPNDKFELMNLEDNHDIQVNRMTLATEFNLPPSKIFCNRDFIIMNMSKEAFENTESPLKLWFMTNDQCREGFQGGVGDKIKLTCFKLFSDYDNFTAAMLVYDILGQFLFPFLDSPRISAHLEKTQYCRNFILGDNTHEDIVTTSMILKHKSDKNILLSAPYYQKVLQSLHDNNEGDPVNRMVNALEQHCGRSVYERYGCTSIRNLIETAKAGNLSCYRTQSLLVDMLDATIADNDYNFLSCYIQLNDSYNFGQYNATARRRDIELSERCATLDKLVQSAESRERSHLQGSQEQCNVKMLEQMNELVRVVTQILTKEENRPQSNASWTNICDAPPAAQPSETRGRPFHTNIEVNKQSAATQVFEKVESKESNIEMLQVTTWEEALSPYFTEYEKQSLNMVTDAETIQLTPLHVKYITTRGVAIQNLIKKFNANNRLNIIPHIDKMSKKLFPK